MTLARSAALKKPPPLREPGRGLTIWTEGEIQAVPAEPPAESSMNATVIESAPASDAPASKERTGRGALEELTIRRRTTGEDAAARALLMRRLRIALPGVALALIAIFFFSTRRDGGDNAFLDDFADLEATTQNLNSVKPQFSGVDARGNPYEITADTASQKPDRREIVELNAPRAITAGGKEKSVVAAKSGVFNTDDKKLLLKDGVTFEHAIGRDNYVMKSPSATVSIDEQTVVTGGGVEGEGPGGSTLKADRMQANNNDGAVVFEGGVSMRLYPKHAGAQSAPQNQTDENGESNE
ncbi:MAG: LPS export ABC transporter periplasmic protein LptC [Alphaproteobacteria bacterium RIFCSPHIGHO2_12_FULL_63_12]|nr:MAG: LPS export ABC transporter periplasmic protein LptC [Alphaproteobacteria bacterium RIFCSPHIGHO2_12_FULL_63_12]